MDDPLPTDPSLTATTIGIIRKPLYIKLMQTFSIAAATFSGGQTATVSLLTIPALLRARSASLLAIQWRTFFNRGLVLGPSLFFPSSAIFFFLAYREPSWRTLSARLYATAGVLLASSVPYTMLLLNPTNTELKRRSDDAEKGDSEAGEVQEEYKALSVGEFVRGEVGEERVTTQQKSTHQLVDGWAWWNLGRGSMALAAGVCGLWAVISEDLSFFE